MARSVVPATRRAAFTLAELLVVMAILGVLMALAVGGTFQVIETQKQNNTENAMRAVHKTLKAHWDHVIAEAKKESPSPTVMLLAGGDLHRARVIWIKLRLMEAFPMDFNELIPAGGPPQPPPRVYQTPSWAVTAGTGPWIPISTHRARNIPTYLNLLNKARVGPTNPNTEPGACLFMALSMERGGSKLQADTLGSGVIADSDADGIKEITDGWGGSLALVRFPTPTPDPTQGVQPLTAELGVELNRLASGLASPKQSLDPLDPQSLLLNPAWQAMPLGGSTCRLEFSKMFHRLDPVYAPNSGYIVPVLVSAGRNKSFGLNGDMSVSQENDANDNVYSFRLRLGARGD